MEPRGKNVWFVLIFLLIAVMVVVLIGGAIRFDPTGGAG